jgi:exosome complex RNA-binding protein Rrp42 (RNase PH superfamily)
LFAQARPTTLATSLLKNSAGSALVKQGDTKVLVANTIQIGQPSPQQTDHGDVVVTVTTTKGDSGSRGVGDGYGLLQAWLQRMLDELLPPRLGLLMGKACFRLVVTVMILSDDGNSKDAALFACMAAWKDTKLPEMQDFQEVDGKLWWKQQPTSSLSTSDIADPTSTSGNTTKHHSDKKTYRISLCMGVVKMGGEDGKTRLLVDPTFTEEGQLLGFLTLVVHMPDRTVHVEYSGSCALSAADLSLAFMLANARADELAKLL